MLRPPSSFFEMSDYQTAMYSAECHKPYLISCNMFAFVDPQPCLTKRTFKGRQSRVSFANATLDTKVHWQSITSVWILCILSKHFERIHNNISQLASPVALESETKCKCHRVNCVCGLRIWINPSFLLETK